MTDIRRTNEVFIAGRYPELTYNPRDERFMEAELRRYLDDQGKALTISGPSKSGKTVLVQHLLPDSDAIWMNGNDLTSVDVLHRKIIDWLGIFDMLAVQHQATLSGSGNVGVTVGIPGVASFTTGGGANAASSDATTYTRSRPLAEVALEGLSELPVPIVIDDFHYIADELKRDITRAIKNLILKTHVIMIAVPHEAFAPMRREPDMNGRIWHLPVQAWSEDELLQISIRGFELLGVVDHDNRIGSRLAGTSLGAPFLMQQLCLDFLLERGILGTQAVDVDVEEVADWNGFFSRTANRIVPGVFDLLVKGPRTHGQERSERPLKDGSAVTDIYGAILYALARLGPVRTIPYADVTHKVSDLFDDPPSSQQVTSSLRHLATIAEGARASGDAALAYKDDQLHILDPFLSFYLRFGDWALPSAPRASK